jgi:oligopeptide/dipeptide ABC transporter ATP-binding protein
MRLKQEMEMPEMPLNEDQAAAESEQNEEKKKAAAERQHYEEPLLSVRSLCKYFPIFNKGFFKKQVGEVKAVDDVSFDLMPGETLGIVGESGCGKTTAGRSILRAINPTSGAVIYQDNGSAVDLAQLSDAELKPLRTKMQMIFQDPFSSLNPRMTVRDIVSEPLTIHGLSKGNELEDRVVEMLKKVGLMPEHRTRYPHAFSGGQRQRIGIARALIMHPSLVVCDEAVSALDVSVQAQVINLLQDLQKELGLTYIFIAHDLSVVKHICDRIAVMYAGKIVELAQTKSLFDDPKHPYTQALLSAVPNPDPDVPMNTELSGEVADPGNLPPGCSFNPRCGDCFEPCDKVSPRLITIEDGRDVSCHLFDEQYAEKRSG